MSVKLILQNLASLFPNKASRKILTEQLKGFCKGISAFVTFLSALATFGAFCFAVWAYHYSSIPEQLVQKFNSEIAGLNEELVDMRKERRTLEEQLIDEKTKLAASIQDRENQIEELNQIKNDLELQIASYNQEKKELENSLDSIKKQNIYNQKYRGEYLADSVASLYGVTFTLPILEEISDLNVKARMARDYLIWLDLQNDRPLKDEPEYSFFDKLFYADIIERNRKMQAISDRSERMPDSWLGASLRAWDRDEENRVEYTSEVFREEISQEPKYKNGLELLEIYLDKRLAVIKDMPKEDRAKIETSVSDYLEIHKSDLEKKISLHMPLTAPSEEVAKEGKIIFENLERFQCLF